MSLSESDTLDAILAVIRPLWTLTAIVPEPADTYRPDPRTPFVLARFRASKARQEAIGGRTLTVDGQFIARLMTRPGGADAAIEDAFIDVFTSRLTDTRIDGFTLWDSTLSSGVRDGAWRVRMFETAVRSYVTR